MARAGRIYLPLDCGYFDDAKVVELSDLAQLADIRGMLLSKRLQSDGVLTPRQFDRILPSLGESGSESLGESVASRTDPRAIIGELVASGLWAEGEGIYVRRGWDAWNTAAADIAAMSRAAQKTNHRRWHEERGKVTPKCQLCIEAGDVHV